MATVLVTGGSGFIAGHTVLQLLDAGHTVRTTLRSLDAEPTVRQVLHDVGVTRDDALDVVAADLTDDAGWEAAVDGVDHVLHVASPVRPGRVRDEDDVVAPARDGALRVLRAARDAGVRRVVLTSAFHAAGFGHGRVAADRVFTEDDWSPLDGPGMDAYGRSKVLAERAAWAFSRDEGGDTELVTVLPVAVMGPVMGAAVSGANHIVQRMLAGAMPGLPGLAVPIVDVRDVAAAHVAAMSAPGAAGMRILVGTGEPAVPMAEIASVLRRALGADAQKVPTRRIPDLVVRAAALFDQEFRSVAADLGVVKRVSDQRLRDVLGVHPRPAREAIAAAGRSLLARGLVD